MSELWTDKVHRIKDEEISRLRAENIRLAGHAKLNAIYAKDNDRLRAENERLREALSFEIEAHEHLAKICGFGTLESIRERRAALAPDPPKETEG